MAYYTFSISRFFLNCANITHQNDNFCLEGLASIQLIIQLEGGEGKLQYNQSSVKWLKPRMSIQTFGLWPVLTFFISYRELFIS